MQRLSKLQSFSQLRFYCTHYKDSYDYTNLLQHTKTTITLQKLHAQIIRTGLSQNPFVATTLITKYIDNSTPNIVEARKVFDVLSKRDTFLYNMIIKGYSNLGPFSESIKLYKEMVFSGVFVNAYTYPVVLKACGALRDLKVGEGVHGHVVKFGFDSDLFVNNSVLGFYGKCGEVELSWDVFRSMLYRDVVSYNSMISSYHVNGRFYEALELFRAMLNDRISFDHATLVTVLSVCAQALDVQLGLWIHLFVLKTGIEVDAALGSGLISMYANCGHVDTARDVFNRVCHKNVVVFTAMIRCYGVHNFPDLAFELFEQFLNSGLNPDGVLFLSLLSACSHAGWIEQGKEIFRKMGDYGINKSEEHYACMVDILGRAGNLEEAIKVIRSMPIEPGKNIYGALLGAARLHNNIKLAEEAVKKLLVLDPGNAGRYVILAHMYEDAEQLEDAAQVRKLIKERNIKKPTGISSIEVDSVYHTFGVEDESHPFKERIFYTLGQLEAVMSNGNNEEKSQLVCYR